MAELDSVPEAAQQVGAIFAEAGHQLYVVGGAVRDWLLGLSSAEDDIDLTTDARPPDVLKLIEPLATAVWRQGERFGTIGATVFGRDLEITTYRSELYDEDSRKPIVGFGDDLETDLSRRDFTINAMARSTVTGRLEDPYGGADDLRALMLRTPLSPEVSFADDPLRMLRAARFSARLGLEIDPSIVQAARELADRMEIVSGERIFGELDRLLSLPDPGPGLRFLWTTGVLSAALDRAPLPSFGTVADAVESMAVVADPAVRWAALCVLTGVDIDDLSTLLKVSNDRRRELAMLVNTDLADPDDRPGLRRQLLRPGLSEIRRVVERDRILASTDDDYLDRFVGAIEHLHRNEPAELLRSPLSGGDVLELFGLDPGPLVGRTIDHLESVAITSGPLGRDDAVREAQAFLDSLD